MRKRQLLLECLEKRLVLSGVGQGDASQSGADWQSVIVSFKDGVTDPGASAAALMQSAGGQVGHVYQHALKGFSAQLPAAAVEGLSHNPMVKTVEPDFVMTAFGDIPVPTGVYRIGAELNPIANIDGVDNEADRVDVDVAIIDSGITYHDDLNVVDGKHFYSITTGPPSRRGVFEDDDFADDHGHGTHVAGTVGALDDGVGVVGVAPGARLWAVKVLDANGVGKVSDIIRGIDWVTATRTGDDDPTNDIDVANMSLGGQGKSDAYREAIQGSVAAGIVYVVAAGNEWRDIHGDDKTFETNDDTIPAAYPEVAAISAFADSDGMPGGDGASMEAQGFIYADDTYADFSNFSNSDGVTNQAFLDSNPVSSPGLGIDLVMPGVDILSTSNDGGYALGSGTSMAAPHAAGLAALYIAGHGPAETAEEVYAIRQALINSGKAWRGPEGLVSPPDGEPNSDSPDGYEENLGWAETVGQVPDTTDIGIVSVTAPSSAAIGDELTIYVDVTNNGNQDLLEDIAVTLTDFTTGVDVGTEPISGGLTAGQSESMEYTWNTAGLEPGDYTLIASHAVADDNDANDSASAVVTIGEATTDVAIVSVDAATMVVQGTVTTVDVVVGNMGNQDIVDSFDVVLSDTTSGSTIGTKSVDALAAGSSAILTFTWDTTAADLVTHTLKATHNLADDDALNDFNTTSVTVVEDVVREMEVTSLTSSVNAIGKSGKWQVFVTAEVFEVGGSALSGVTVSGYWEGAYEADPVFGITDSGGSVTFSTPVMTSGSSVTFTVTGAEGYVYNGTGSDTGSIVVTLVSAKSKGFDLDALAGYLASVNTKRESAKKDVDSQAEAVDLLMAYGV